MQDEKNRLGRMLYAFKESSLTIELRPAARSMVSYPQEQPLLHTAAGQCGLCS